MERLILDMSCDITKPSQYFKHIVLVFIVFNNFLIISDLSNFKCDDIKSPNLGLNLGNSDNISLAWEWYKIWGTEGYEKSYDMLNDSLNNIYVLGKSENKLILLKYNRSGNLIFNKAINISKDSVYYQASFSIDSDNNIFIVRKNFLVKVNSSGDFIWEKNLAGYNLELYSVITDKTDCVYLTGSLSGYLILMKFDNTGEQLWNTTWNGLFYDCGFDIAFDNSNNIFVTGETNSYYNWWDMQHNADIPILKFNSSGYLMWNVSWRSPYHSFGFSDDFWESYSHNYGNAITLDSNENIYITGYAHRYPVILCYNQSNGTFWYNIVKEWGVGKDLAVDINNNILVISSYGYTNTDFLLLKYSTKGQQIWNRTWGQKDYENPSKMTFLSSEEIFVVGSIWNNVINGYDDIVLVKFGVDTDNDRISDFNEDTLYFTDPFNNDTDNEGIIDGLEVEIYNTNPNKNDTDDDLLSDYDEIFLFYTDPLKNDSDDDLLSDYDEIFLYFTDPLKNDTDDDFLSDYDELFIYYTDPDKSDTDGDGFSDYDEIFRDNTDPNNFFSSFNTYVIIGTIITAAVLLTLYVFIRKRRLIFTRIGNHLTIKVFKL